MKAWWMVAGLAAGLLAGGAQAQAPVKKGCTVTSEWAPGPAEKALRESKFEDAQQLFAAMPASSVSTAGQVRALLGQDKLREALALAQRESAAHPDDALLLDVLGEARFRRGEVSEAATAFNRANQLDPCDARIHYDVSRYMNLAGLGKSAQGQLDLAHRLAPADPMIKAAWERTQRVMPGPQEQVAELKAQLAKEGISEEKKAELTVGIQAIETRQKGDCELVTPVATAKIDLTPIGNAAGEGGVQASGMDVFFNGKRKRMLLDTGAGGMLLTREAALSLGLKPEVQVKTYGVGDKGMRDSYITHIDSVRLGTLEFRNCMVQILETRNVLPGQDGLIGADVFRNFLVTLDFPDGSVKLAPLPKRPDEATTVKASLDTDGEEGEEGRTLASTRKDRYIGPEMQDWTKVFREDHFLIFPTSIGKKAALKLFILDTGSSLNLISPEAAREVSGVGVDNGMTVTGISGEVAKVQGTGPITLGFGGVSQYVHGMTSVDTSGITQRSGTDISGFIGYQTLKELSISIDYRDNLVKIKYTPHLGAPALGSQR